MTSEARRQLGLPKGAPIRCVVTKRSLDARKEVVWRYRIEAYGPSEAYELYHPEPYREVGDAPAVIVVGAGPAGLVAAWLAAKKGHQVVLAEKSSELGGQFRLASVPPCKQDIATALRSYINHCKKHGVDIRPNTEVNEALIKEIDPDTVILATGGTPLHINLPGIDGENVMDAVDVLDNTKLPGNRVLVIGGGMTGVETADYMAEHGKAVTIVEMRPDIALDEASAPRFFLIPRLKEHGVTWEVNATVRQILPDGVVRAEAGHGLVFLHQRGLAADLVLQRGELLGCERYHWISSIIN